MGRTLGSAHLRGAPLGGRQHAIRRPKSRRATQTRGSAGEGEAGGQGGLRGLFSSLGPKSGTVRLSRGDASGGRETGAARAAAPQKQKPGTQQKAGTQKLNVGTQQRGGTQQKSSSAEAAGAAAPGFLSAFLRPLEAVAQAASGGGPGKRDAGTVFVAGATGRLGVRIVRELAAAGFRVRAGVRGAGKADELFDKLEALAGAVGPLSAQDAGRIKPVTFDLDDPGSLLPAIGNASRVVCAVGASEAEFANMSAPRRIDYEGTERLIQAAAAARVEQFVLVTSLGTGKFGLPASVLNLFGGVLTWKRRAEEALERSGLPYLIVRPGGMERPKDDHKLTHIVRLSGRDTLFGGTVSRLQVAELIAAALSSPDLAENKTVEVVAETTALEVGYEDLLAAEATEIAQEARLEALQAERDVASLLEVAAAEAESARAQLAAAREEAATLAAAAAEAQAALKAVEKEQRPAIQAGQRAEAELAKLRANAEKKALLAAAAKAVAAEAQRAQRDARLLTRDEVAAIRRGVLEPAPPPPAAGRSEATAEVGGAKQAGAGGGWLGGWPGRAASAAAEEVEEEEVREDEEEEEEEVAPAEPAGAVGVFAKLFGGAPAPKARQEEEEEEEKKEEVPAQPAIEQPTSGVAGLFGRLVGGGQGAPAPAPAPAAAPSSAAHAPPPRQAEQPAAGAAKTAGAAPAAQQEREAAQQAQQAQQLAELQARRAAAAAESQAAEERALLKIEQEKAQRLAEAAAQRKAAAAPAPAPAAGAPVPAAAPKAAAPAPAPTGTAAAGTNGSSPPAGLGEAVPANVEDARRWIEAWRARAGGAGQAAAPKGFFSMFSR